MTRKSRTGAAKAPRLKAGVTGRGHISRKAAPGRWPLQDAKARFSELVRRVKAEGPQVVTVHGREEVVIVSADEFRRLKGDETGQALINALQASPHRDLDIEPTRAPAPVRDVVL
jgi:prevent-host-death family protein